MYKTILASVSIAALSVSTAMAADLGAMPVKAPIFVAPTWTGAYVGLNAGYAWGNADGASIPSDLHPLLNANVPSLRPKGFIGGGQIGYNWQAGSLVLGAELDFSGMNVKADQSVSPFFIGKGSARYSTQYDWLLTARARAGITIAQNWLLYVTGGLAVTQVKDSISGGNVFFSDELTVWSGSKTLVGGTVGGGLEYAFAPNWSLKAEYLYAKFEDSAPSMTYSSPLPSPGFGARTGYDTIAKFSHDLNIVRIGVNYKFGG